MKYKDDEYDDDDFIEPSDEDEWFEGDCLQRTNDMKDYLS